MSPVRSSISSPMPSATHFSTTSTVCRDDHTIAL